MAAAGMQNVPPVEIETAVPTLKVMRLQKPALDMVCLYRGCGLIRRSITEFYSVSLI